MHLRTVAVHTLYFPFSAPTLRHAACALQAESDAARKKRLKREKQKAAAAAAAAAATEAAKAPVAVEQGQELSAEEKAGLAEKKRLKLLEDRKKQMEAKKATDKKKGYACCTRHICVASHSE